MPDAVAILGMACRFPGARSPEELWTNLSAGRSAILRLTEDDLDAAGTPPALRHHPRFVPAGTMVDGYDCFDTALFGFSEAEAAAVDPQHRVFLECAWQALEAAGANPDDDPERIGVWAAAAANGYRGGSSGWRGDTADLAGFVSSFLGLEGPSLNVRSACSSSLVAVHLACEALLAGRCDLALAGGVSIRLPQKSGYLYEEGGITSPDGFCRAFDARAEGTVFGSGAGVVVLARLEDALAGRYPIAAVILGSAVNNDGAARIGFTAPSLEGQAEVISLAQAVAGIGPETVTYIEAHGTGTPLGDAVEIEALARVFGAARGARYALGSVKTGLGHLETASGIAGLIKTALALQHQLLPPSLGFERPNPEIGLERTPFRVVTEPTPWETGGPPRRAGVSSFGIGGTNAHILLEEAPPAPVGDRARPGPQLLVLSAATESALARRREDLERHLAARPDLPLADVAWTLQVGRRTLPHRLALVRDETGETTDTGLATLGERWVAGEDVDWRALHAGETRSRVLLPVYPLESRRCWSDQAVGGEEATVDPLPLAPPSGTAREQLLREIWREVLGAPEVGLDDDFFELGGDSILGALIAGRARAHGLAISADHLFVHSTVARLAAAATEVEVAPEPAPAFELDPAAVDRLARKRSAVP